MTVNAPSSCEERDDRRVDVADLGELRRDANGPVRDDLHDLAPGHEARHVEVVDRHVEEDSAGDAGVVERRRLRVAARDPQDVYVTDRSGGDSVANGAVRGVEATVEPDHEQDAGTLDGRERPVDLLRDRARSASRRTWPCRRRPPPR